MMGYGMLLLRYLALILHRLKPEEAGGALGDVELAEGELAALHHLTCCIALPLAVLSRLSQDTRYHYQKSEI